MTARSTSVLPPLSPNGWLRWEVVSRLLPPGRLDVLEMGCGQGGFGARLAQRYHYLGVEPDAVSCTVARARVEAAGGGGEVRQGDESVVAADELFDLVVAFEVIEHIEDDASALAAWASHLRPGGWLLLSTPAWQKRFGPADEMVGHFRRYDPPVLRSRLAGAGLTTSSWCTSGRRWAMSSRPAATRSASAGWPRPSRAGRWRSGRRRAGAPCSRRRRGPPPRRGSAPCRSASCRTPSLAPVPAWSPAPGSR